MHRSFREVIELLESQGKLVKIKKPVKPEYEMAALMKTVEEES